MARELKTAIAASRNWKAAGCWLTKLLRRRRGRRGRSRRSATHRGRSRSGASTGRSSAGAARSGTSTARRSSAAARRSGRTSIASARATATIAATATMMTVMVAATAATASAATAITGGMAAAAAMASQSLIRTADQGDPDDREKDRDPKNQCAIHPRILQTLRETWRNTFTSCRHPSFTPPACDGSSEKGIPSCLCLSVCCGEP